MYSRSVGDSVLTLSASGWVYNNLFVLYDYETESLWYPFPNSAGLTCISGTYADEVLLRRASLQTAWKFWVLDNRNSKYMKLRPPPGDPF